MVAPFYREPDSDCVGALIMRLRAKKRSSALPGRLVRLVALLIVLLGPPGLLMHPSGASSRTLIRHERTRSTPLPAYSMRSFVLRQIKEEWPQNRGYSALAHLKGVVMSRSTVWFQAPHLWRLAGRWLVPPHKLGMADNTSLAVPFLPFPGVVVNDGTRIWSYDSARRVGRAAKSYRNSELVWLSTLVFFGLQTHSLSAALKQARVCYSPRLLRSGVISRRPTYVIDMGVNRCLRSRSELGGRLVLWVDKQRFLVLGWELFNSKNGKRILRNAVIRVRYDVRIPRSRFTFRRPRGSRLTP